MDSRNFPNMVLRQLPSLRRGLKAAYRRSDALQSLNLLTSRRVGWFGRRTASYDHSEVAKAHYDLCGEFMVFGWGESLHFAPRSAGESLLDSKIRHQRLMISKLELREGMAVIDVGCGIGGPMRRVVQETGAKALGVNNNEIQLEKSRALDAEARLDHLIDYLACTYMDMDAIEDDVFDRAYAIESTCYAPDKAGAFAEIYRVLKPGALFWTQEMCLTEKFDPGLDRHRALKEDLMYTLGLKDIATFAEVNHALETAGFEIMEAKDRAVDTNGSSIPWYQPMDTLRRKAFAWISMLAGMVRLFPKGSIGATKLMDRAADAYVAGGKTGIYTPLYCTLARKPHAGH